MGTEIDRGRLMTAKPRIPDGGGGGGSEYIRTEWRITWRVVKA